MTYPPLKKLYMAVGALMAGITLTISQNAEATDIEIYKSSNDGTVTIMLLLDISGSMNLSSSAIDDYYLRSGNGPQGGNQYSSIPTPTLDALKALNPNTEFAKGSNTVHSTTGVGNSRDRYTQAGFNTITNWGSYDKATAQAELSRYLSWSPNSYCQNSSMIPYNPPGWTPTLITEIAAGGYERQYCRVPIDYDQPSSPNYIPKQYWYNSNIANNKIVKDPTLGCDKHTNPDGTQEYRCYSRMARLKNALYDVINGNPAKGVTALGNDIHIGIATLGVRTRYNGIPWSPNSPMDSDMDVRNRDLGAIRIPARKLTDVVNGKTHKEIINEFLADSQIFEAHTGTPTARSYAEVASYMMGTTTLPPANRLKLQERDLFNGVTYAHRVCIEWDNSTNPDQCTRFEFSSLTSFTPPHITDPNRISFRGTENDQSFIYGKPAADFPRIFNGIIKDYVSSNGSKYPTYPMMMGVGSGAHLMFGYPREYVTGFPFSSPDSKTPDGSKYQQPASLINANPQCSGQGIYVLSDGAPAMLPYEEGQMQRALGAMGNTFKCSVSEVLGNNTNNNDWECIFDFADVLKDGSKNPSGLPIKTAAVGFAREYASGNIPAYDPKLSIADNLKNIDSAPNGTATTKQFARWGVRGEGGWYVGTSSQSVVDSINSFIANLVTEIPSITTGQPFVPIDPLNRLAYMPNAYFGSFAPKVNANYSFWAGNLNKYNIKDGVFVGESDKKLFNSSTGFLDSNTVGLWGADGMKSKLDLRSNNRPVFTNTTSTANNDLTAVNLTNLFNSSHALYDATHRNAWLSMLGYEVDINGSAIASTTELTGKSELRQLGALLHSTPIILTQSGTITRSGGKLDTKNRKDYLLYGSTQGVLHMVDLTTGKETLAFVPYEMMTNANSRKNFQNADKALGDMTYGIDGQWTAYTQYVAATGGGFTVNGSSGATSTNLSDKGVQWAYGGLRMGGRSYYALDLSDITNPKLKFHINPNAAGAGTPLSYMGQSWSKPTLGFVKWQGSRRLVMFVGGGYDEGYEDRTYEQTNGKGAGVYMFDAHDGSLLWWSSKFATDAKSGNATQATNNSALQYSVPGNISTFDRNNDGLVDNLFFGDLGGQVFRVDFDNDYNHKDKNQGLASRVVRIYNGHQAGGLSPRFYEAPTLSAHSQEGTTGQFGVISIASGNRSSPLAEGQESAKDGLFVIFDRDVLQHRMTAASYTPIVTDAATDGLLTVDKTTTDEVRATQKDGSKPQGWKFYFTSDARKGKLKGYSTTNVISNFLFVDTYSPEGGSVTQNSCNAGIIGESYQEAFCMPGGVCTKEQQDILGKTDTLLLSSGDGSSNRVSLGVGTVQSVTIPSNSSSSGNSNNFSGPKLDCSIAANKDKRGCENQKISSITNKPVRWYENTPRS